MTVTAYPLSWPFGVPRTARPTDSRFKATLAASLENVRKSLQGFGRDTGKPVTNIVLSSNVTLGSSNPADAGVAAWFLWDGQERCIAVDRYPKVQENLQAIHAILEARRTEMRHGGLHIVRQTFTGFIALPPPQGVVETCWQILGLAPGSNRATILAAHREKAMTAHPDRGGDATDMAKLNGARDAALSEIGEYD